MISLQAEHPDDAPAIEAVLDHAFGPGRHAKTSERVRERGARFEPALTRVALEDGRVIGVCRIWRVEAGVPLYFLGPLAVDPDAQHHGLGGRLVRECLTACRAAAGAGGVICVGAFAFFSPMGFARIPANRIVLPGPVDPQRFLWLELRPGGLDRAAGPLTALRGASPA